MKDCYYNLVLCLALCLTLLAHLSRCFVQSSWFATIWDDCQGYGLSFDITFAIDSILNCTIPLTVEGETMIVHYMSLQQCVSLVNMSTILIRSWISQVAIIVCLIYGVAVFS